MKLGLNNIIGNDFSDSGPGYTGMLDEFEGAVAAYSLKRLTNTYSGPSIRIARKSDGVEQDVGFLDSGKLDTTQFTGFSRGADLLVVKIYDQIGSTDPSTAVLSTAPKIYDGTTGLVTENGEPAILFDGIDDALVANSSILDNQSESFMVIVFAPNSLGANEYAFGVQQGGGQRGILLGVSSLSRLRYHNSGVTFNALNITGSTPTQYILSGNYDGSTMRADYNNLNTTQASTITAAASNAVFLGTHPGFTTTFSGTFQEGIIFNSSKTSSEIIDIRDNINSHYNVF